MLAIFRVDFGSMLFEKLWLQLLIKILNPVTTILFFAWARKTQFLLSACKTGILLENTNVSGVKIRHYLIPKYVTATWKVMSKFECLNDQK